MMKPVVKIGCSAVLSEEADEEIHGLHISQAVALAVEQANSRGDLPFVVEMLLGDDKAQPEAAIAVAQRFIADPQVLGSLVARLSALQPESRLASITITSSINMKLLPLFCKDISSTPSAKNN
jgi:hypothetical protein